MKKVFLCCLIAMALPVVRSARAAPITYTITGTASGTIGSTSFSNQFFVYTLTSDTSIRRLVAANVYAETAYTNTFTLSGVGTGSVTNALDIFDNQPNQLAGVTDSTIPRDLFQLGNAAFGTYSLLSSLGPLSTTSAQLVYNEPTTLGTLNFTSFTSATFAAAVPEPSTWALLGVGALGAGVCAQRRRTTA